MAYYRSVQYSVWCDWCPALLDYAVYRNLGEAEVTWRKKGWIKTNGLKVHGKHKWRCPECKDKKGEGRS